MTGDTTYGTVEHIVAVEDQGIRAYVPLPDFDARRPYYGLSTFTYDAEQDAYRCPQGSLLHRHDAKHTQGVNVYGAEPSVCKGCQVKTACTASDRGRQVHRSRFADYLDRVRVYRETAAWQQAMRKRAVCVEPLLGEAKDWHGLGRFRLRGLGKVDVAALLIATGQNLKRLLRKRGWGRRPWPRGAPDGARPGRPIAVPPLPAALLNRQLRSNPGALAQNRRQCRSERRFFNGLGSDQMSCDPSHECSISLS